MKKENGILTLSYFKITKAIILITFLILLRLDFSSLAISWGADAKRLTHYHSIVTITDNDAFVWKGNYTIRTHDDIVAISGYRVVAGFLRIKDTNLYNLDGLESLIEVGLSLTISGNKYLSNISGLSNLSSAMQIVINDNDALENIHGLGILKSVENLMISCNDNLLNVDGLDTLTTISGSMYINNNSVLTSLSGLSHLITIIEDLVIVGNRALSALDLVDLTHVGRDLYIYDNIQLPNYLFQGIVLQLTDFNGDALLSKTTPGLSYK